MTTICENTHEARTTVAEAAEMLGVSERTVWRYLKSGRLEGITTGDVGSQRTLVTDASLDALRQARDPRAADVDGTRERLDAATAECARLEAECARLEAQLRAVQRARRDSRALLRVDVLVALVAQVASRIRSRNAAHA